MVARIHSAKRDILLLPVLRLLRKRLYLKEGEQRVVDPEFGQSKRHREENKQREDTKRKREKRLSGKTEERDDGFN